MLSCHCSYFRNCSWDQDPASYFMPTVGGMIFRTDRPLAASSLYTSSLSSKTSHRGVFSYSSFDPFFSLFHSTLEIFSPRDWVLRSSYSWLQMSFINFPTATCRNPCHPLRPVCRSSKLCGNALMFSSFLTALAG